MMSEQIKCKKHYNAIPLNECPMCLIKQRDDLLDNLEMLVRLLCHPGSFVSAKDIDKAKAAIAAMKE